MPRFNENLGLRCFNKIRCWKHRLTAAGGVSVNAHGDVAVVLIIDTEGTEHAAGGGGVGVDGVSARGPGGVGGATEVGAVVPCGGGEGADAGGSVGDGGSGPGGREVEGLEVGEIGELKHGNTQIQTWSAHGSVARTNCRTSQMNGTKNAAFRDKNGCCQDLRHGKRGAVDKSTTFDKNPDRLLVAR
jgi:hypothetical protein